MVTEFVPIVIGWFGEFGPAFQGFIDRVGSHFGDRSGFAFCVRRRRQDDIGHLCFEGSNSRTFGVHKSAAFVFTAKNDRLKKGLYTVPRGPFFAFPTSRDGFLCFDV